jgi:hypothetical protein
MYDGDQRETGILWCKWWKRLDTIFVNGNGLPGFESPGAGCEKRGAYTSAATIRSAKQLFGNLTN